MHIYARSMQVSQKMFLFYKIKTLAGLADVTNQKNMIS